MRLGFLLLGTALLPGLPATAAGQERPGVQTSLLAGPSPYDLSGTGTGLAINLGVTVPLAGRASCWSRAWALHLHVGLRESDPLDVSGAELSGADGPRGGAPVPRRGAGRRHGGALGPGALGVYPARSDRAACAPGRTVGRPGRDAGRSVTRINGTGSYAGDHRTHSKTLRWEGARRGACRPGRPPVDGETRVVKPTRSGAGSEGTVPIARGRAPTRFCGTLSAQAGGIYTCVGLASAVR